MKFGMITIKTFVFNPFMENTYLLYDETGEVTIVDPGCYEEEEEQILREFVSKEKLKVKQLVNTHCHIDHVLGNSFVQNEFGVSLGIHKKDLETLRAVKSYAPNYGFQKYKEVEPEYFFEEGEVIKVGNHSFDILFVPGHAPGHVVFLNSAENICIGGDVLFRQSIGRTDLPGGDHDLLIDSIQTKMFSMDPDTLVYPGHGETTTIGFEMRHNPFCSMD